MAFFGTSINESPVIAESAGAAMTSPAGRCVKYDANGDVILCAVAGEEAVGILSMQTPDAIADGDMLTVQVKDGCMAIAGGAFAKGAALAVDVNGKLVAATEGDYALAQAHEAAAAAGDIVRVRITKAGFKPATNAALASDSMVLAASAGAALTSAAGKCVKCDASGDIVLCSVAGEAVLGVLAANTPASVADGGAVSVQLAGVCNAVAGGSVSAGDLLAVNASGALVTASTTGHFIVAQALEAGTSGNAFKVQIIKAGYKPA